METSFKEWIKSPFSKIFLAVDILAITALAFTLPSFLRYGLQEDAVKIAGKKYVLSDVKDSSPILYSKFQSDYKGLIRNTFSEFAQETLFSLEAKEKGIATADVLKQGLVAYEPSESEITQIYNQYKSQLGGKPLAETRDKIIGLLKNQKEQDHGRNIYRDIVSRYPVEFLIREPDLVRVEVEEKNNPSLGPIGAPVTVVEFSDFECPFCKRSQEVNERLREKYKGKIRWVFRDFPLPFHQDAMYAHMGANCAAKSGKYWETFHLLFENTGKLPAPRVDALVLQAGVPKAEYEACMKDKVSLQKEIEVDIADGQKLGVSGTPAFFINGIFVSGALPFENFEEIIDKELK